MSNQINEINEILTHFIDVIEGRAFPCLSLNQIKLLLSYITNLQEENERLLVELNQNMIERNNYLSRNEKAIEYIKNEMPYLQEVDEEFEDINGNTYFTYKEWNDSELLNILQGSDENGNE